MRILVIDNVHPHLMDELSSHGMEVNYQPDFTYEDTYNQINKYHGLVVRSKFQIDRNLLEQGTQLKFLARAGVGLDIFDEDFSREKNITLINAAGANANAVSEHVLGMMLSLFHKINRASSQVKKFRWERESNRGMEMTGKTVAIIGYGNVGKAVAEKLVSFNCHVIAYDKYQSHFSGDLVQEVSLEEVFEQADILTLHVPLTKETRNWCDADFFRQFKKPIYFFNTARGKIVNLAALEQSLRDGNVLGVGLDVLENENFNSLNDHQRAQYSTLFHYDNVILTPHVAGWSNESYFNISEVLAKNILRLTK